MMGRPGAPIADSVGLAMLVVLDTLTPGEPLALVLHDMFAVSFEEIAPRGRLMMVLAFTVADGRIAAIDAIADPGRLRGLELAVLE